VAPYLGDKGDISHDGSPQNGAKRWPALGPGAFGERLTSVAVAVSSSNLGEAAAMAPDGAWRRWAANGQVKASQPADLML
jgi:hypothetical protein